MLKFWTKTTEKHDLKGIAKTQLDKNRGIFESLRDYDQGKKDISTTHIRKHLRDLQTTS